jgi:hypothetical protein
MAKNTNGSVTPVVEGASTEEEKKINELFNELTTIVKGTGLSFIKLRKSMPYLKREISFKKINETSATFEITSTDGMYGTSTENTPFSVMEIEGMQFIIDQIKAKEYDEVIDYKKFVTDVAKSESRFKLSKSINHSGKIYDSIEIEDDKKNGSIFLRYSIIQSGVARPQSSQSISSFDENFLSKVTDLIKEGSYL